MKNISDVLNQKIISLKSPIVVGLDPAINEIPQYFKERYINNNGFDAIGEVIFDFCKDVIDTVFELVPAVKPQMAFFEMYGSQGVRAFERTVLYAKTKGLLVIEDGKRNDIGNTAQAYADGHLGTVDLLDGQKMPCYNVDFLTVSPFLGSESLIPFINACLKYDKGIFVLVKTSNQSSADIQDITDENGLNVSQIIARFLNKEGHKCVGESGYSAIGAVVGATYPHEAQTLRKLMPNNIFLVPGYGAQGAVAEDIISCFNDDGLGALVNSSRNVLYAYKKYYSMSDCSKEEFEKSVKEETVKMRTEIYNALKKSFNKMLY